MARSDPPPGSEHNDAPGEPPHFSGLKPTMLTASELRSRLEELFDWLHTVEAAPDTAEQVDTEVVQRVRDTANMLLAEQRERHRDEMAPRGG